MATLAELKANGEGLSAHCNRPGLVCGHHKMLPLDALIAKFGPDHSIINDERIGAACRCEACGYRGAKIMRVADTKPNGYAKAKGV